MAQLVVLYKTPKNTDAFDKYYFETHVPLAKKLPGLKKYDVSKGHPPARAAFIWLRRYILIRSMPSKPPLVRPKGKPLQATSPILQMAAPTCTSLIRRTCEDLPQWQRPQAAVQSTDRPGAVRSSRRDLFARSAGVHVDFHADRHFDDFRSFPGHRGLLIS